MRFRFSIGWHCSNDSLLPRQRYRVVAAILSVFVGCVSVGTTNSALSADSRSVPNIVLILIDDMGWRDLGCYGSTFYRTTHIDRLCGQGMKFTQAYTACNVCSPTRASIMTGRYPARLHLTNFIPGRRIPENSPVLPPDYKLQLDLEEVTIAEALKPAGYVSGSFGKWHLGNIPTHGPDKQGFDVFNAQPPRKPGDPKGIATLTQQAMDFLEKNQDRPFLLYLPHFAVHIPLEGKKELIAKYEAIRDANKSRVPSPPAPLPERERGDVLAPKGEKGELLETREKPGQVQDNALYAAMIESLDDGIGQLLAKLDELKLADRTVVFFFSDNGGLAVHEGPNTPATSNAPLRAGKGYLYEGGVREPLMARWPGVIKPASLCDVPVCSVDFFPTILEIAGIKPPADRAIDGVSILPLLKQSGTIRRDALYWHYPHFSNQGGMPGGSVRQGDFKLIEFYADHHLELYNLKNDMSETNNLAAEMPEKAQHLRFMLDLWRKAVDAQPMLRNPDYDPAKPTHYATGN